MMLNTHEAKAVRDAMLALNNVGGRVDARMGEVAVHHDVTGYVEVRAQNGRQPSEVYRSQAHFFEAYGLT